MPWRDNLTFAQLRSVVLVYQSGTIQSAADQMGLSASQVSRNVSAVEREFGSSIFLRRGPTLSVTRFGEEILPRIVDWLDQLLPIIAHGRAVEAGTAGRFRLGYTALTAFTFLPSLLKTLRTSSLNFEIDLIRMPDPQCEEEVASGRLDAALISPPITRDGLELLNLHHDSFALAVPADWGLNGPIHLNDPRLTTIYVAPLNDWPGTLQLFLARCESLSLQPHLSETVNDAIGRMVLALAHDSAALVSSVRSHVGLPGITVIPIHGFSDLGFTTSLVLAQRPTPLAAAVANLMRPLAFP